MASWSDTPRERTTSNSHRMWPIAVLNAAGAGQTVKAANQLLTAVTIEAVAEAVMFLEAHSVDPTTAIGALAGGLAGSAVLDRRAPDMVQRNFEPGFRCKLHHKDL